ncbi:MULTISPECIES: integrase [unclassified Streptomyces]|uniref:integrase n=1 Tax=unclassified Streptomyces TaxID=2593676 RepID=UPI0037931B77
MTAVPAVEGDPYVLPMPSPDSPIVLPKWTHPDNSHPVSRYREMIWPLAPLIDNPGTRLLSILWTKCPELFRGQLKLPAWTMINGQLRPTRLRSRGMAARARCSAEDMANTSREWIRLARWLEEQGITDLAACTEDEWRKYPAERWKGGVSRGRAEKVLTYLTDLWAFDRLSAHPSGVARPPWDSEGIDDFLPAVSQQGSGENTTEPLDPLVIGPLLVWAMRMVEDFADDILAAWAESQRLHASVGARPTPQAGRDALTAYLVPLIEAGVPLPSTENQGRTAVARKFIAATTGAGLGQVDRFSETYGLTDLTVQRPGPCPLNVPVTGHIDGRPWREHLDFNEAAVLMRHLGTAAMIICLFLTGMRPQEAQVLRSGCCPDPEPAADGAPGRHLIHSHHFKNVTDEDGIHVSYGEEREVPWVAITPVVRAIRVLERMVPEGEHLFSSAHHDFHRQHYYPGVLKGSSLNTRIEGFIAWVNQEATSQNLLHQTIPEDPYGSVGLSRFRRTLAWHIARRPGGLIALAIQYGHMRTVLDARTSSGYGSRSRRGIHSELDVETALAAADTAASLRDRVAAGEKVSGPAARRAITGAASTPRFEGRIVPRTFAKKATQFLARDGIVLYDNPDAFLICAFKRDNALCDPDPGATAPRQYACQTGCGNTVRTDTHALRMRQRADEIEELASHWPEPVRKQIGINADNLRTMADAHDATAQTAEALI